MIIGINRHILLGQQLRAMLAYGYPNWTEREQRIAAEEATDNAIVRTIMSQCPDCHEESAKDEPARICRRCRARVHALGEPREPLPSNCYRWSAARAAAWSREWGW